VRGRVNKKKSELLMQFGTEIVLQYAFGQILLSFENELDIG
jgi:hypothetical protein